MPADPATIQFYQAQGPRFTLSPGQAPSRHLDPFLDRLAPGARILELGCGAGRDAARMVERRFTCEATDGTPAMVRKARERFGLDARVLLFEDLDAEAAYDAVWAHASLLHVARADLSRVLGAIHRALRPGGWHFASFKLGTEEGRDLLGRLHNFPDAGWIADAYRAAGFSIAEREVYPGEGADGTPREWIALTLQG